MIQFNAVAGPTSRLLRQMLRDKGLLSGPVQGVVNYGYNPNNQNLPTLNGQAGRVDKYTELVKLDEAGVATVPFSKNSGDLLGTYLARRVHHTRGRDIQVNGRGDYYTELIPKAREYRTWVFRDKHLATYEKVLSYPERNGRRGRSREIWNWGNGYGYEYRRGDEAPRDARTLASRAVKALGLDFGAVDLILGRDGFYYVLEVNTAPGTQGQARQGVTGLVEKIDNWAKTGFPAR